jgi:hypothetical protein
LFDLVFSIQIKREYLQPVQAMTQVLKRNFNKMSFAQGNIHTWEVDGPMEKHLEDEIERQELENNLDKIADSEASMKKAEEHEHRMPELIGFWWSRHIGLIEVQPWANFESQYLHVTKPGAKDELLFQQISRAPVHCHILLRQNRCAQLRVYDRVLYCMTSISGHGLVHWLGTEDGDSDVWDQRLWTQIDNGAKWIRSYHGSLHTYVLDGLTKLKTEEVTESTQTVALCIATKNRLWQLSRALPLNLMHAWPHREWVRIHLVICDCEDKALEWVEHHCQPAMNVGLLQVYSTNGNMPHWHASVGKNTSHMVASEDILVNVDGDNLIGPNFPLDVVQQFEAGYKVVQYEYGEGSTGRIAYLRSDFMQIRGYDEERDVLPMGAQDIDIIHRLKMLYQPESVYKKVKNTVYSQAIPNDLKAKVSSCGPRFCNMKWSRMDALNRQLFRQKRDNGRVVRNVDKNCIGVPVTRITPIKDL